MYDIVIIGAGCAGMTAGIYAARAGKTVLLLETETIGGQISFSPHIENFPSLRQISGTEFSSNLFDQTTALGVDFEIDSALKITDNGATKTVTTEYGSYDCKAVIIATGVKHREIGIAREKELVGKGVSYCAVCDGAFFKGKAVAVAGGGNTALQDAIFLSQYCEKIYLIHRRNEFRGEERLVKQLQGKANVEFVLSSEITSLNGEKALESVTVRNKESGEEKPLNVSGLFVAIGQIPGNEAFRELIELDSSGYIAAGEDCVTSVKGIFAAGDCRTKEVRQLVTAAADGAVAALAACEYCC